MGLLDSLEKTAGGIAGDIGKSIKKDPVMGAFVGGAAAVPDAFAKVFNPHMRGHDSRDTQKVMRDMMRRKIANGKTQDVLRHNTLLHDRIKDVSRLQPVKPVLSTRGGDVRHLIQEGRKKAQFNKANSAFTKLAYAPTFTQKY